MAENLDPAQTVEAWKDITLKVWRANIDRLNIGSTGALRASLYGRVKSGAGALPESVDFAFNYYGKFTELGVGRGVPFELSGVIGKRKPKPWYHLALIKEVRTLAGILEVKYAKITLAKIKEVFNQNP